MDLRSRGCGVRLSGARGTADHLLDRRVAVGRYGPAVSTRPRRAHPALDHGWLFLAAGLAACAVGVLVPAQSDLRTIRAQVDLMAWQIDVAHARADARREFHRGIEQRDPAVVRRLAAAQLGLIPADDTPLLISTDRGGPVGQWIDGALRPPPAPPGPPPQSALERLTTGRHRLLFLAAGVVAIFIGLLIDPVEARSARRSAVYLDPADEIVHLGGSRRRRRPALRALLNPLGE
jgi:hypothetical protein